MASKRTADGGRAQIIEAARCLFAGNGFHQTNMAELAARASVSVGQIYRLYAHKTDIIAAIIQIDADQRLAELQVISDAALSKAMPIRDAFEELARTVLNQGGEALTFQILAEGHRDANVAAVIARLCERYRELLRGMALLANDSLEGDRLACAGEILLSCLFGLGNRELSRPDLSVDDTARLAADFFLAALR
ncbi:TetR/AcrR family transcriptional regulator [Sphingomonas abietis]|uniref:Helix-turn-helix domain containing protein n=1 Tax=Sphingomonas abietis TaxID=3012344 RepID=A0ABY7NR29_9SPHN|nr:TetR/AcrR family transcriptional regulator [Sphingomonas abietis]WBO23265.1 helix-turn-helix domain containing protein [Sphingomonas abietis]